MEPEGLSVLVHWDRFDSGRVCLFKPVFLFMVVISNGPDASHSAEPTAEAEVAFRFPRLGRLILSAISKPGCSNLV
jgi:hypothetical protein